MSASVWTEDRVRRLKTLWLEGRSAEHIGRELACGITRNAVLGKVRRLGLSAGRAATAAPEAKRQAPRAGRTGPPATSVPGAGLPRDEEPVSLLDVGRYQCRWPLADPTSGGFRLCGARVSRGAYCGRHAAIGYRPARETPRALERLAEIT